MLSYRWLCGKPYHIIYDTTPYTILYHTIPYYTISYHIIYYIIYHTISHHISHHHLISYHIISYSTCSVASHDISHTIVREMPQLIPSSTPDISRFFFSSTYKGHPTPRPSGRDMLCDIDDSITFHYFAVPVYMTELCYSVIYRESAVLPKCLAHNLSSVFIVERLYCSANIAGVHGIWEAYIRPN